LQKNWDFDHLVKERKKLVVSEANLYDEFFNNHRPHMGLKGLTPLEKLQSFPKFNSVTYVYS